MYNLWAKKYEVSPRRYSPPKKSFKKAKFPENIPLQNSPAPTRYQVGKGSYPVIAKYVGTNI